MAAGYAFGAVVTREPAERRRLCWRIGLAATAAFLLIGGAAVFFTGGQEAPPALFRLLNQRKYPASQLFLLMTLGPSIAVMPLFERPRGWAVKALEVFGRVPMFYYLLHIPVIHMLALAVWFMRDGTVHADWFTSAPYVSVAEGQRWSLGLLYVVFAFAIVVLYFPCRWYADVKVRTERRWLRIL
jgi:uncharacterized membrane protein